MYHLGLLFPDFLKHFTLQRFKPLNEHDNHPISIGAMQHIERDANFHSHAFFDEMCSEIAAFIDKTPASAIPKTWFLAHILLEMGIDRILMEKHPNLLDEFYKELVMVKEGEIESYFRHNNLAQASVFFAKLSKFNESRWLFQYLDDEKLPISLNHVYFRIGLSEKWDSDINIALVNSLPELLNIIRAGLPKYV